MKRHDFCELGGNSQDGKHHEARWPRLGGNSLPAPSLVGDAGSRPVSTKSHQFPPMATTHGLHPWLSLHTKDLGGEAQQGTIFQDLFEDTMSLEPNSFQIHEWALDCPDITLSSSNFSVLSLLD